MDTSKATPRPCAAEVSNRYTYGWHGCRNKATWMVLVRSAAGPMRMDYCKRHADQVDRDRILEAPRPLTLKALAAAEGKADA